MKILDESRQTIRKTPPKGSPGGLYSGYSKEYRPLNSYAVLMGLYAGTYLACWLILNRNRQRLPEEIGMKDLAMMGLATHKLSRIITHDWVTSPMRAPFTEFDEATGAGEISESPRGRGLRRATGELLTCPWCMGPWVAAWLFSGFACWPRRTRMIAGIFSAVTLSDFMHHVYVKAKEKSQ